MQILFRAATAYATATKPPSRTAANNGNNNLHHPSDSSASCTMARILVCASSRILHCAAPRLPAVAEYESFSSSIESGDSEAMELALCSSGASNTIFYSSRKPRCITEPLLDMIVRFAPNTVCFTRSLNVCVTLVMCVDVIPRALAAMPFLESLGLCFERLMSFSGQCADVAEFRKVIRRIPKMPRLTRLLIGLNFRESRQEHWTELDSFFKLHNDTLQSVAILAPGLPFLASTLISLLNNAGDNLRELNIIHVFLATSLLIRSNVTTLNDMIETAAKAMSKLKNLRRLNARVGLFNASSMWRNLPSLAQFRSLQLGDSTLRHEDIEAAVAKLRQNGEQQQQQEDPQHQDDDSTGRAYFELRELTLNKNLSSLSSDSWRLLFSATPFLEHLYLSVAGGMMTEHFYEVLTTHVSHLKSLKLVWSDRGAGARQGNIVQPRLGAETMRLIPQRMHDLAALTLMGVGELDDAFFVALAQNCEQLQILGVSGRGRNRLTAPRAAPVAAPPAVAAAVALPAVPALTTPATNPAAPSPQLPNSAAATAGSISDEDDNNSPITDTALEAFMQVKRKLVFLSLDLEFDAAKFSAATACAFLETQGLTLQSLTLRVRGINESVIRCVAHHNKNLKHCDVSTFHFGQFATAAPTTPSSFALELLSSNARDYLRKELPLLAQE